MVVFPTKGDVLAGHPVKSPGQIPSLVRIARILREVRCSRRSGRAVDRGQQHQVAAGVVDLSSANCQAVLVPIEPQAVVDHVPEKALLGTLRGIAGTTDATAMLASHVTG